MSNDVITKKQQDSIPLHRNTMPVAECDVHSKTIGGKPCKAIEVPILSCASVWLRVQKEAEAWIAPGGKLIDDKVLRNRQINRAYARLWQADRRFQWAGLAAFASKQVGCGLLHAADNVRRSQEEADANHRRPDIVNSSDGASINVVPSAIGGSAAYMYQQLALGNTALFLDIYPLHRFYMLRGLKSLERCLQDRSQISTEILWPIEREVLAFGRPYNEVVQAFQLIEKNLISESVKKLAYHEQINVLQPAMYDNAVMKRALDGNQFSWATQFPSGVAAEVHLTLSSSCYSTAGIKTIKFRADKAAKLYDKNQRMEFVYQAATRFAQLLDGPEKAAVEKSLREIADMDKP